MAEGDQRRCVRRAILGAIVVVVALLSTSASGMARVHLCHGCAPPVVICGQTLVRRGGEPGINRQRFSERKGTALFGTRLPHDKAIAVFQHLQDGCGVRPTARLTGVDKDTVVRYALQAGSHAQQTHEELVAFSPGDAGGPVR